MKKMGSINPLIRATPRYHVKLDAKIHNLAIV